MSTATQNSAVSLFPESTLQTGLQADEAARLLALHGPNLLPRARPLPAWRHLLAQMIHFFAVMLWVAGVLAIFAGMPHLGAGIFVVIVLNGLFAFVQEYRAERAGERLRDLLPRRATVVRGGRREELDAAELVPGDLLLLGAGDRISADARIEQSHGLSVDSSALTGESVPGAPQRGEAVFAGTFVTEGEGRAVVTATGKRTRLAGIAELSVATPRPPSPLAIELHRVVRVIAAIAVTLGAVFLLIAMLVGIRLTDAFLFALGVTVALVPEGLLPTVTLSLAAGAQRMAERGALVRRLESVETLGSTTFICTDKTGTLTCNEMCVVEAWTPQGGARVEGAAGYAPAGKMVAADELLPALSELALAAVRCSAGRAVPGEGRWMAAGNPLDAALDVFARRLGVDADREEARSPAMRRFSFDPRRRRMSVVAAGRVYVKGAPEAVFDCCADPGAARRAATELAARGLRVLAFAERALHAGEAPENAAAAEKDLLLLGLLAVEDPPRPEVAASIAECRKAGIRVAMVTGDHPETARALAREVGLLRSPEMVIEGKNLPADENMLGALMDRDGIVVSRVAPEEKLRIARALRKRGHVVAMTGDGVNDAPALREANIGVAMGRSGTDVAREAADLVLLDDNFATIVAAVEQGRTTFANARRFLTYHLTDNVAELTPFVVWALSGGRFPLAIGVLQVLALDIGTDVLPAVALGVEPSSPRALSHPPQGRRLVDTRVLLRAFGVLGAVESVAVMAAFLVSLLSAGWRPGLPFPSGPVFLAASGAAFTAVVLGQMANAFACRSATLRPVQLGWRSNRWLLLAVGCELAMLAGFLYIEPLARLLGQAPPNGAGYLAALLAIPAVLAADAAHKRWRRRKSNTAESWMASSRP